MFWIFKKKKPTLAAEVLEELELTEREILVYEASRERSDHMVNLYSERAARLRSWLVERGLGAGTMHDLGTEVIFHNNLKGGTLNVSVDDANRNA